jgi:hypothetical protein
MQRKLFIFHILILTLFTSCSTKVFDSQIYTDTFNNLFDDSKKYQDTLQYTQKADVINNKNDVVALLNVTYLNPTLKEWDNNKLHSFIVGVYIVDGNEDDFILTINNSTKFKQRKVTKDMNILGEIPLENKWATYYLVQISKYDTNQADENELTLKLLHKNYISSKITFFAD